MKTKTKKQLVAYRITAKGRRMLEQATRPVYDKAYFIAKFEAIPEEKWCTGSLELDGKCCAAGHCGDRCDIDTPAEAEALRDLFDDNNYSVARVNDGDPGDFYPDDPVYRLPTPKQRILAALRSLP